MRISDWSSDVCSSDLANTIYWNGTAVDPATLKSYLRQTTQMDPEPELRLEPDPNARYALVDQVLAVAKQSQVTKMRSEEHTSELQSLMRISYAVFCLKQTHQHILAQASDSIKHTHTNMNN